MATEKVDLKSDEVRELLGTSPAWLIRWGSAILLLLLVALVVLSLFIKYPANLQFPVTVSFKENALPVEAVKDGSIRFWLVDSGDVVSTGQPVALQTNQADYNHVLALQERLSRFDPSDPGSFKDFGDLDDLSLGNLNGPLDEFRKSLLPRKISAGGNSTRLNFKKKQVTALKKLIEQLEKDLPGKQAAADAWERSFMEARAAYSSGAISVEELQRIQAISKEKQEELTRLEAELIKRKKDLARVEKEVKDIRPAETKEVLDTDVIEKNLTNLTEAIESWLNTHLINAPADGRFVYFASYDDTYRQGDSLAKIHLPSGTTLLLMGTTSLPDDFSDEDLAFFLQSKTGEELALQNAQIAIDTLPGNFNRITIQPGAPSSRVADFVQAHSDLGLEGRLLYGEESFLKRLWKDFGSLD